MFNRIDWNWLTIGLAVFTVIAAISITVYEDAKLATVVFLAFFLVVAYVTRKPKGTTP